ncbi:hypothetical protein CHARACLAT_025548, partial [Characodon lateralis]|nr:hypothetical protein [Characodon lateralis]
MEKKDGENRTEQRSRACWWRGVFWSWDHGGNQQAFPADQCIPSSFSTSLECEHLWYLLRSEAREEIAEHYRTSLQTGTVVESESALLPSSYIQTRNLTPVHFALVLFLHYRIYKFTMYNIHISNKKG